MFFFFLFLTTSFYIDYGIRTVKSRPGLKPIGPIDSHWAPAFKNTKHIPGFAENNIVPGPSKAGPGEKN